MVKKVFSVKRVLIAVLIALFAVCTVFTVAKLGTKKSAFAAEYSYQEGRDGFSYSYTTGLTVNFTTADVEDGLSSGLIKWGIYLIDENTGITYDTTTHKYTDSKNRQRNIADYYFLLDGSIASYQSYTLTVPNNATAYHADESTPSSATDFGTNTGKTLAEVIDEKNWIVGVGPMFSNWWTSGYGAPIDYYVGRGDEVVGAKLYYYDYDATPISNVTITSDDMALVAPAEPSHSPWTFNGWYCDTNKQIYTSQQLNALTAGDVIGNTKVINVYATYDKHLSGYIEFTSVVLGEDDIADDDNGIVTNLIDANEGDETVTVVYNITHNDGINSILLIPEYDTSIFSIVENGLLVKGDTTLGGAEIGTDGAYRILLENTGAKYEELDSTFLSITFNIDADAAKDGEYYFGLKLYPVAENDSSVAYFIEDGLTKGEQSEIEVKMVYGKKLVLVVKQDGVIDAEDAHFTYAKTVVTVAQDAAVATDASNLIIYYTYNGDATVVASWETYSHVALNSAPIDAGHYILTLTAEETSRYRAAEKSVEVLISPRDINVEIDDKTSVYLEDLQELTYVIVEGSVCTGDDLAINLSTTATATSPAGEYTISGSYNNANYFVEFENGVYTITARAITITAGDQTSTYDGNEPEVDQTIYTVTATVGGAEEQLPAGVTVVLTKDAGVNAGTYTITPSLSGSNASYTVSFENGVFTIESVGLTTEEIKIYFSGDELTYDAASHDLLIVDEDIPEWISENYVASNNVNTNANTYTITVTVTLDETTADNYTDGEQEIVFTVQGIINRAQLTITADNKTVVYGSEPATCTPITVNGVEEETISVTYTVEDNGEAFTPSTTTAVGVYDIIPHAQDSNYTITFVNGTYTVTKAEISDTDDDDDIDDASDENLELPGLKISVAAEDIFYNRALVNSYKAMVGEVVLVAGTDYTVAFYSDAECLTEVALPENAGMYYIKVSVAGTDNYDGGSKVASFEIKKIQLAAPTVTYNGATFTIGEVTTDVGELALKEGTVISYLVDDQESNGTYTSTTAGTHTYTVVSNNDNYLPYNGTTETCYSVAFAEGEHPYNATDLEEPATLYAFAGQSVTLPEALVLDGYTFVSWDGNNAQSAYTPAENVTLTAIWNATEYTITFKYVADGEVVYTDTFFYGENITYPVATVVPVKSSDNAGIYYTFANKWALSETEYEFTEDADIATLTGITVSGNADFVAVFDTNYNSFTVTYYMSQDGSDEYSVHTTAQVTYLSAIEYVVIANDIAWFKVDSWYTNSARTNKNIPANMPNHDVDVYGTYKFDIGAGDVNADGLINADDITLYRQYIVGGYEMIIVENGTEWATVTAEEFNAQAVYFLRRVADINADLSKDIRDVSITRMSIVEGYNWDILNGVSVSGNEIARTYQSQTINDVYNNLVVGRRVILANNIENVEGIIDVDYNGNIYIDLNGHTITLDSFSVVTNARNATVTVKNGVIRTENGITITAPNGTVILDNLIGYVGESEVNLQAANSSLHFVNIVKFYKTEIVDQQAVEVVAPVNVEKGTHVVVESAAEVEIEKIVVTENFVAAPVESITLSNNTETVIEVEGAISNAISSVEELIAAADNGGEYILTDDLAITTTLNIFKDFKLDGNGHTITATKTVNSDYYAIYVTTDYNTDPVAINVEINNLTLISSGFQVGFMVNGDYNSVATINNVNITADGACVYSNGILTVNANDCEFTQQGEYVSGKDPAYYSALDVGYGGNIIATDCVIVSEHNGLATFPSGGHITINNTSVTASDYAIWARNEDYTNYPEYLRDSIVTVNSCEISGAKVITDKYTSGSKDKYIAKIVIDGTEYTYATAQTKVGNLYCVSLVDAFAIVNANGGTVTVLSDIDFSDEVYAGYKWAGATYNPLEVTTNNVTIDLNGHTFSNMGNAAICAGNLLAADGRISNFTIKNGTLLAGTTSGVTNSYVLGIAGCTNATIKNVTTNGGINVFSGSTNVVIDGCTVNGTKYYAVCAQSGSDVTIKNSTITKNTDSSVSTKIMFWTQGADKDSDMATELNPTGAFEASSITLESGSYTLSAGGTFSSGVKPVVKGGTFNFDPTAYVADGFQVTESNGIYTVVQG